MGVLQEIGTALAFRVGHMFLFFLCCVFVLYVFAMLHVSLDCQFLMFSQTFIFCLNILLCVYIYSSPLEIQKKWDD